MDKKRNNWMMFRKKSGCPHKQLTKIIEREKVFYKCDNCGAEVNTLKRRFFNVWVRYQRYRGTGYGFSNFVKEFMLNMVQGGMIMTTLKVMWDKELSWQFLVIFFILWEVFNIWLGWWLIYKGRLAEIEADYNSRLEILSPIQREMLDRMERIDKYVAKKENEEATARKAEPNN